MDRAADEENFLEELEDLYIYDIQINGGYMVNIVIPASLTKT